MGVLAKVLEWIFGGAGCHVTSKGVELSYKLGYLITVALFFSVHTACPVCPVHTDLQGLFLPIYAANLTRRHYKLPSF